MHYVKPLKISRNVSMKSKIAEHPIMQFEIGTQTSYCYILIFTLITLQIDFVMHCQIHFINNYFNM